MSTSLLEADILNGNKQVRYIPPVKERTRFDAIAEFINKTARKTICSATLITEDQLYSTKSCILTFKKKVKEAQVKIWSKFYDVQHIKVSSLVFVDVGLITVS